jgi:hypothetical protein
MQTERYRDRNVRDAQEFTVKLGYLHRNPPSNREAGEIFNGKRGPLI